MENLRAKIAGLAPEQTLRAEGAMRAQVRHGVDVPPEAPLPEESDEKNFELDMTPWEKFTDGS